MSVTWNGNEAAEYEWDLDRAADAPPQVGVVRRHGARLVPLAALVLALAFILGVVASPASARTIASGSGFQIIPSASAIPAATDTVLA